MKIVNLETFRSLPPNTLYAKFTPNVFDEFCIKGATWEFDFLTTDALSSAILCLSSDGFNAKCKQAMNDVSVEMDFDSYGRDGFFDKDQLFAIYEDEDIIQLIDKLKQCLRKSQ